MSAAQAPITAINRQIAGYQSEISAYGQLSAAVYSFQTALGGLTSASAFQANAATPSNTAVLSATTDSTAISGNYNINVSQLATAQTLVAAGQVSATAAIGGGSSTKVTFQFGTVSGGTVSNGVYTGASFAQSAANAGGTVTIDSSNNSLQGIASAINAAGVGVSATVINDGSGTPYRLSLSSSKTGAASAMKISVSGDATLQSLLGEDPAGTQNLSQTQVAQDASLTVNGLAVTSASNAVTQVIKGTTLNLAGTGSTSLAVAQDTKTIASNVQAFVTAYNTLDSTINTVTAAGVGGAGGGPLAGQYSALQVQNQLRQALSNVMIDATGNKATLADVGITFQKDGSLSLDSTKLNAAMALNPAEVGSLFAQNGVASDGQVKFVSAGSAAAAGSYNINISTVATQGSVVGNTAAGTTITAGVNDGLTVVVDGTAASVTIPAGSYTAGTLATAVQAAINGSSALNKAGASVSVSQNNGVLSFTSASYGSKSFVSLGGNAGSNLIGSAPTSTNGVDVAGTINGFAAKGSGQTLTAPAGSAVDGMVLTIAGGSTGMRGTIGLSQGFANILNNLATQVNSPTGVITAATNALNGDVTDSNAQITRLNQQLSLLQAQYNTEFSALDTMMSGLNATQSYLTGQLNSLANTTNYIYSGSSSSSG
ncbi:MAG: flagellar filament capping protein FliD [Pseudomonadota bacterium]|nr:flagellar filament capping protein FliD [Pseudomonadota bacterium]